MSSMPYVQGKCSWCDANMCHPADALRIVRITDWDSDSIITLIVRDCPLCDEPSMTELATFLVELVFNKCTVDLKLIPEYITS